MGCGRPAAVGGFIIGGFAILALAVLSFGNGNLFAKRDRAVAFFQGSVGGLATGSAVTFRGVRVGSVANVALVVNPTTLEARIPVYLELDPGRVTLSGDGPRQAPLPALIKAGLRAELVSQSLVTGQMIVELEMLPDSPEHVVGGTHLGIPEIPTIPSDLQELREQLTKAPIAETVSQALRTLVAVEKLANRVDTEIGPLATDAQNTLASAKHTFDVAGVAIGSLQQQANAALEGMRTVAGDAHLQLVARGTELSRTLTDADAALRTINELAISADALIGPHSRSRDDLQATLRDLAATASSLRDLSQTIERDPTIILTGRTSR